MIYRFNINIILLVLIVNFLLPFVTLASVDRYVTATGKVEIIGKSKDEVRNKALYDAFRNAVEKGLGVLVKSQTEVKDAALVKDEILSKSEGYVIDHEIIKEGIEEDFYVIIIKAQVAVDKIDADFKKLLRKVKAALGNPSISFILTTWEKIGKKSSNKIDNLDTKSVNINEELKVSGDYNKIKISNTVNNSNKVSKESNFEKIDENIWKKYPDTTIIDAFQQEFKEKGFDVKATDKARNIALVESLKMAFVNPSDRKAVREEAEKEGANFVARGEARIIDKNISENTGNFEITAQIGIEIIDVNSGDVVSSYSNTATASSKSESNAKFQSLKKVAVLAAKTLADQTLNTWQERSLSGRQYTIEFKNIKSMRKQKKPIMDAIEAVAQITSQTNPQEGVLMVNVIYKGDKKKLSDDILNQLESKKGFSESEFDGPFDEGGKIVFKFIK